MQKELFHARSRNEIIDTVMLLQHPPVYTFGRRSQMEQPILDELSEGLRLTKDSERVPGFSLDRGLRLKPNTHQGFSGEKSREGIYTYRVDRGGGATYHGPGQLVGYPIIGLKSYTSDFHAYLRMLEDVMIGTLKDFSITSQRLKGYTGVWVEGEKIGSIGVRIVKGITMHGFALNVNNDLEPFNKILPCNIKGVKMTSMSRILRTTLNIPVVEESLIRNFALIFGVCFEKKCNPPYRFK